MAYGKMAAVYDYLMKDVPYGEWVSFTETHSPDGGGILDLGCGTGEIAIRLAEKGYKVTGVDLSEDMLAIANDKTDARVKVQWLQQDIRNLEGLEGFDTVISYFDVINYITSSNDLQLVFQQAYQALKPGGFFLFDVQSTVHFNEQLIGETFAEVYDDISYIWFCQQGEEVNTVVHDLTFFIREENGSYSRFDEYHTQRGYYIDDLKAGLEAAGFEVAAVQASDATQVHKDEAGDRLFFICRRR